MLRWLIFFNSTIYKQQVEVSYRATTLAIINVMNKLKSSAQVYVTVARYPHKHIHVVTAKTTAKKYSARSAHSMMTKRGLITLGICFCGKYSIKHTRKYSPRRL